MPKFNVSHKTGIAADYSQSITVVCAGKEQAARIYVEDTFGRHHPLTPTHDGGFQIKVRQGKGLKRMYVKVELLTPGAGESA